MNLMKPNNLDLTIDFHSHVLPGCDHGSYNVETSLKQMELARAAGIQTLCSTSHFYPHKESVESFLQRRQQCYQTLQEARIPSGTAQQPQILLGAEVLICEGMEDLPNLPDLCLQGTNLLLLEMPFYKWPETIRETALAIHERGDITVILAHVDRYPEEDIQALFDEGIQGQINADSLATKRRNRKTYLRWIHNQNILFLGSDIHGTDVGYKYWEKCYKLLQP